MEQSQLIRGNEVKLEFVYYLEIYRLISPNDLACYRDEINTMKRKHI